MMGVEGRRQITSTLDPTPPAREAKAKAPELSHKTIKFIKNGRVTIPRRIRQALDIRHGQKGALIEVGGALLILPHRPQTPALFDEVRDGLGTSNMFLEEMVSEMRRIPEGSD